MKNIFITIVLLFSGFHFAIAQTDQEYSYLVKNSYGVDLLKPEFQFEDEFYANSLFFFGFIHGSEKPQILDLELLKALNKHGVKYYAPEVDYSLAYFFNQYLNTGNEKFLDFACKNYLSRVPQDASIQFKNKWKELYAYNQVVDVENQITIIGLDQEYSAEITLTHLAFIAPTELTGISIIDSLKHFKNLEFEEFSIISGKPVYKSGKTWDDFFGTEKTRYFKKFKAAYEKDSTLILNHFGAYANDLKHLMSQPQFRNRESVIFNNFKALSLPLIEKGEKIYSNFGYYHIQQGNVNGNSPLAKLMKDSCDVNLVTIIGMMTRSECLKKRKFTADGNIHIKEVKFRKAQYNGYKTSKSYDGDGLFEKVNGIKTLKKISGTNDIMLFKLDGSDSPFTSTMKFADFSRGGKNWKVDKNLAATDYFQYIILIQNSKSNIPLEEEKDSLKDTIRD